MDRRVKKFVRSTTIVALIKAGAFDYSGVSRYELLCKYDSEYESTVKQPNYIYDYEAFGFYLSESPFDKYDLKDFSECKERNSFMSIMQIEEIKIRKDKRGEEMAFVKMTNNLNTIDVIIFSSAWKDTDVSESDLVFVKGTKDKGKLLADKVERLNGH